MPIRPNRLLPEEYAENFADIRPPFEQFESAHTEANKCLFCYDAPCIKGCPTGIDIPKFIKQISTSNIRGSAKTILNSNIFGGSCARVCPVEKLCEGNCVYNLMNEEPVQIAKLQRYSTDAWLQNDWKLFTRKPNVGKKVAVVGAGPAGLSCAHALSLQGVEVEVYEKEPKGGGLVTYGVAAYKVTDSFIEQELEHILQTGGIHIKYNQTLGGNVQLHELEAEYDAVYLAIGVGIARRLNIPGEELEGVEDAIEYIYELRSNPLHMRPVGDKVAVIGLGMTAIDAATQARRLGARQVTIVYRRTRDQMPCTEEELELALKDGCEIKWLAAPVKIQGNTRGHVSAMECMQMELGAPDKSGRSAPVPTGNTFTLEVDMVIKATGQQPFTHTVTDAGLSHQSGRITITAGSATNRDGVFAGGDCVNGGREVVDAVQAGKEGAAAILKYLNITT